MKHIIIALLLVFLLSVNVNSRRCGVSNLRKRRHSNFYSNQNVTKQSIINQKFEPIRIHVDYSSIQNHPLEKDLRTIVDKAIEVLQSLIKVKRLTKPLLVSLDQCSGFPVPTNYEINDADLVIFVGLNTSESFKEDKTEAEASFCLQESVSGRPIAGYIEFSTETELKDDTRLWTYMTWLSIHEITHVLGMDDALYKDFVNKDTLEKLGLPNVMGIKTENDITYNFIKSSKVLEKARKHFNCDELEGVPLESGGADGTAGAHWSKKYMNTDYMIGDSYGENLISEITLALLEDSGWYQVDYGMANLFVWGKNKGCKFFEDKCVVPYSEDSSKEGNFFISNFIPEFCANLNNSVCSRSHIFRGQCVGKKYQNSLKENERLFNDPYLGGGDDLTQKCPIASDENIVKTDYYESSCRIGTLKLETDLEKVCPECACFMSTLKPKKQNTNSAKRLLRIKLDKTKLFKRINLFNGEYKDEVQKEEDSLNASCYEYKCHDKNLVVVIKGREYACPKNEVLEIPEYDGFLVCPDSDEICDERYQCKFGCTEKFQNKDFSTSIKTTLSQVSTQIKVKLGRKGRTSRVKNNLKVKQFK